MMLSAAYCMMRRPVVVSPKGKRARVRANEEDTPVSNRNRRCVRMPPTRRVPRRICSGPSVGARLGPGESIDLRVMQDEIGARRRLGASGSGSGGGGGGEKEDGSDWHHGGTITTEDN